jgi:DTW domain-containing protein YfiP
MSTSAATICCTTEQKWQNCAFLSGIFRYTYVFIWCSYTCICAHLPVLALHVRVRVLVLMHQKEYLGAGDDAKLLMAMLPTDQARLFVYGRSSDWASFAAELADDPSHTMLLWPGQGARTLVQFLEALPESSGWRRTPPDPPLDAAARLQGLRLSGAPPPAAAPPPSAAATHAPHCDCGCVPASLSLMEIARLRRERRSAIAARAALAAPLLCDAEDEEPDADRTDMSNGDASHPGLDASDSGRDASHSGRDASLDASCLGASVSPPTPPAAPTLPLLRVVVLDGVYNDARALLRTIRRRLPAAHVPPHVALHPDTLSVYHRSKSYSVTSGGSVRRGETGDEAALRVCTVEAAALLLQELGEPAATTEALVAAVVRNNEALGAHGAEARRLQRLARKEATPHQPRGSWARAQAAAEPGVPRTVPPPPRPEAGAAQAGGAQAVIDVKDRVRHEHHEPSSWW